MINLDSHLVDQSTPINSTLSGNGNGNSTTTPLTNGTISTRSISNRTPKGTSTIIIEDKEDDSIDARTVGATRKSCGHVNSIRISDGEESDPNQWLWMAALISREGNKSFCGATLISERYLITAAHCVFR